MTTDALIAAAGKPARRRGNRGRDFGILAALVVMMLLLSIFTNTFLTGGNLVNVLDQAVVVGLLACGETLCIISGAFDLAASSVLALSAISAVIITQHFGVLAGFLGCIVVGAILGTISGIVVVVSRVHSFIATLAMSIIYRGLAVIITAGAILYPQPDQLEQFQMLTWPSFGGITSASVLFLAVVAICWVLLSGTTFGRRIFAIGGNEEASRLSGIRAWQVRVAVFAVSGVCAALAGLVLASRGGSAQSAMGTGLELSAIAAAVVGGTSVMGGEGAIWRGLIGVFILTLIGNGFNLLGWNTTYQQVVQGALILGAVTLDQYLRRRRN